jgi:uncharacterized protein with NRDE domain
VCLLALYFRAVEDAPVVVGANREEFYNRPGEPPQILPGPHRAVGGRDPLAGGTWLGVNERGLLAAVTNRRKDTVPERPRSRGLLVRDLLGCASAADAVALATRELDAGRYAGCNVLCADRERAVVLHAGDWLRVQPLPPGLHVMANGDINAHNEPRVAYAAWWLGQHACATAEDALGALRQLCGQAGNGAPPVCLRDKDHGTVSSTLVALRASLADTTYLHAQGPPDGTPYEDYSRLLREIAPGPEFEE